MAEELIRDRRMEESWVIYWRDWTADTYLYGSKIQFHKKDEIEFWNEMMAPGIIIKQWYSKTNYQANKIEPTLPLIDGENRYQLVVNIDCEEKEHFLIRLVFYDKYDKEVGFVNIRDQVTDFKCPIQTYSYKMQLINSGMTHFYFHYVVLRDITAIEQI